MIEDSDVVAVRAAANIVSVIGQAVALKRVGRRWVGLCPFHGEKSPSFSVNEEAGLYYCFGCQRKGDAITFLREHEGLDFIAAVERLAGGLNLPLRYTDPDGGEARRRRHRLTEAVEAAVQWYHQRLLSGADAGTARGYLRSRGITGDEVRAFRLGWAPGGWDELARSLRLSDQDLRDAGLGLINRRGRQQDFFRNRILFPIFDPQGDPIGFGGRRLEEGDGPKYLNPGGTPIYDKSKVLYGLSASKADIVQVQEAIVCEGYTDVIGLHRVGVRRAVATCGTALTEDHVKLLTRFAKRLVLAFDADGAGQAAAERFHQWEQTYQLDVVVAALPEGQDPGELARRDPDALRQAITDAKPFLGFRLQRIFGAADLRGPEGRARAAERALSVIAQHPNPLVRDQYLMEVASHCRIEVSQLRDQLPGAIARAAAERASATTGSLATVGAAGHEQRRGDRDRQGSPARFNHGGSAGPVIDVRADRRTDGGRRAPVALSNAELDALRVAVEQPDEAVSWLDGVLFAEGPCRRAFAALVEWPSLAEALDATGEQDPEAADLLRRAAAEQTEATLREVFVRLSQEAARRTVAELRQRALSAAEPLLLSAQLAYVAGLHTVLMTDSAEDETKVLAGTDLLAWLLEPGEGT
ncbi:MAG: DNA primase [Acidimicrobiales bacterium]